MNQNRLDELIAGYCDGSLTEAEAAELRERIDTDPAAFEMLRDARTADKYAKSLARTPDSDKAWSRIEGGLDTGRHRRTRWIRVAAAAVVAAAVAGTVVFMSDRGSESDPFISSGSSMAVLSMPDGNVLYLGHEAVGDDDAEAIPADSVTRLFESLAGGAVNEQFATVSVPRGGTYTFTLSDGTALHLNSDSEVRIPVRFSDELREIYVSGEVFLDVTHDPKRPFVVHAQGGTVRVLGTKFNLSAYPEDAMVITTLVEGAVEFSSPNGTETLDPGEQTVWGTGNGVFVKRTVDTSLYTSWVDGMFEYEKMPLHLITRQFSRWYDVHFVFADDILRDYLFTGVSRRDSDLGAVLGTIEKTTDIEFEIKGKEVTVRKKQL